MRAALRTGNLLFEVSERHARCHITLSEAGVDGRGVHGERRLARHGARRPQQGRGARVESRGREGGGRGRHEHGGRAGVDHSANMIRCRGGGDWAESESPITYSTSGFA